ncbi:hypothetical protein LAZ67_6000839 [Cordylochernes scorpioides]|uniref:Amino acid transporter n=1 Tax=Cordylochernes scorpioides TaxID=51811 RepID=A0ABY6KK41_9ARAC|nr:hypothetical protein LAZ67_6000839 [Cordylochernes scorpioides]
MYRDRIRTSINVMGDAFGAGIVDHLSRHELEEVDAEFLRRQEIEMMDGNKRRKSSFGLIRQHGEARV